MPINAIDATSDVVRLAGALPHGYQGLEKGIVTGFGNFLTQLNAGMNPAAAGAELQGRLDQIPYPYQGLRVQIENVIKALEAPVTSSVQTLQN